LSHCPAISISFQYSHTAATALGKVLAQSN